VYLLYNYLLRLLYRSVVFADPTREEEDVVKGALTIVTLGSEKTCKIYKPSRLLYLGCFDNLEVSCIFRLSYCLFWWLGHWT